MTAVIRTERLTKLYGTFKALDELDLCVEQGEVFGFLGPNGSGKSTTIRLLLDLLRPTSGRIEVLGADPRLGGPDLRRRIGYLPGEPAIETRQTAGELLTFFARLRGDVSTETIHELAERFGLDLAARIRGLSKGNRQKVALVQAFMHRPDLLILDEPTSGLDPLMQQEFRTLVRETCDAGQTVFMSSHILSEVQHVADRVGIIRAGHLVTVADVDDLREQAIRRVEIRFDRPVPSAEFDMLPNVQDVEINGSLLRCSISGSADALVKAVARHTVLSLLAEEPDLEDIFLSQYEMNSRGLVTDAR
jgi:ABC-2 type transport system ATP-binding protein